MDFETWFNQTRTTLRGKSYSIRLPEKDIAKEAWQAGRENMVVWDYEDIKRYYYSGNLGYYRTVPDFLDYLKENGYRIVKNNEQKSHTYKEV